MKRHLPFALTILLLAVLFLAPNPWRVATVSAQGFGGCDRSAAISVASGQSAVLVALIKGRVTRVCGFVVSGDTLATTALFSTGTGTTCGTGTLNLTGAMRMPDEGSIVFGGAGVFIMQGLLDNDVCITTATGAVTGMLSYAQ